MTATRPIGTFMAEVSQRKAKHLLGWLRQNRKVIFQLIALRAAFPGYPVGSGAAEGTIRTANVRMKGLVFNFQEQDGARAGSRFRR